eukprot:scaffold5786_cov77-Phaeocystis_antarctica.AAC.2
MPYFPKTAMAGMHEHVERRGRVSVVHRKLSVKLVVNDRRHLLAGDGCLDRWVEPLIEVGQIDVCVGHGCERLHLLVGARGHGQDCALVDAHAALVHSKRAVAGPHETVAVRLCLARWPVVSARQR